MSLRQKMLASIALTVLLLVLCLFAVSWFVLLNVLTRIEERLARRDLERVTRVLEDSLVQLRATARDWAQWDDTYAFVRHDRAEYVEEYLSEGAFRNLRVQFMIFVNSDGTVKHAEIAGRGTSLDNAFVAPLLAEANLDRPASERRAGVAALPSGRVALLAAARILPTSGMGPAAGWLVMGRTVDSRELLRLSSLTQARVEVWPLSASDRPDDVSRAVARMTGGSRSTVISPLDETHMGGYALLRDLQGEPAALLRLVLPRDVYLNRHRLASISLAALLVNGQIFGVVTLAALDRQVLDRLRRLGASVSAIGTHGDPTERVPVSGDDELGRLAGEINGMLGALEESQYRYRSFIRDFRGLVYQIERNGRLTLVGGAVERITGYTQDDLLEGVVRWQDLIHPEDADRAKKDWAALVSTPRNTLRDRYRLVRRDGQVRWLEAYFQNAGDEEGHAARVQGMAYDVTDRVETEKALIESQQAMADVARAIPSGLFTFRFDPPDRLLLLDGNPEAERLTRVRVGEVRGRDVRTIWSHLSADKIESLLEVARTGVGMDVEECSFKIGQEVVHFRFRAFRLPGDRLGVAFEDISAQARAESEREQLEEQLHHSQKMEAIGQLAGGVAHDFNNLLSAILGYASLLRMEAPPESRVHEAALTIEQAAERAAELTRQLLGFARRGKLQNKVVDLHETLAEVNRLLERTIEKNIRIVQRLNAPRSTVQGDPSQLQQVLLNLAVNARDAMPDGGDLVFESRLVELDEEGAARFTGAVPGTYVAVSVIDVGTGIAHEHMPRIFEPFFTTKEQGKGTGMGLAMVYGIVKNHGGFVDVESEPGAGAVFTVYLPAVKRAAPGEGPAPAPEGPVSGTAHVLLVDDEDVVRRMGTAILSRLGYRVTAVTNGVEAVDYYTQHGASVDLVILDMVMPEMGGHECFRALKRLDPGVRAILSSGYGFDGKVSELIDEGMLGFIQKPYRVAELSSLVANALNTGRV